jgi:hypothetical protein
MNPISEMDDDLRPEYDFTQMPVVARGKGRKLPIVVQLEPDVAALYPDSASVNEALRQLAKLTQTSS